jgi:hypothetical protein
MPALKQYADKNCKQCGSIFNRGRLPNGRLEGAEDYYSRKFCCHHCYTNWHKGSNHGLYKQEGSIRKDGYVRISLGGRRIYLHRYLMEQFLGRSLETNEHVHHKDNNPKNNVIENLALTTNSRHLKGHYIERKEKGKINERGQFSK